MQTKLNPQQQAEFNQKYLDRVGRMIMSWDNELRYWHPIAIKALDFAKTSILQIPQNIFIDLFKEEKQGLNMNTVATLCNNIEGRSADEMGYTGKQWAEFLLINHNVAMRWKELADPIEKSILKELEIMNK